MATSRRFVLVAVASSVWLAGCPGFDGPPNYTLSEGDLQRLAARHFPIERRLLEVLKVEISAPVFHFLPERDRVAMSFDITVHDRLLGGLWGGRLALNSMLRYAREDHTLRLDHVEVDSFTPEHGTVDPQAGRVALLLAEHQLEGLVIYTLPPDKLARMQALGYEPGAVNVTTQGLVVSAAAVQR